MYLVEWAIDIEADTKQEAAVEALRIQRDPNSTATLFEIDGALYDAASCFVSAVFSPCPVA